eukprot:TRINITY_DN7955_c0_g1_i1.p1 TRINITY_DN7955_c0_g1~~TRINITY_DN7955_c0_g1_i1.p1  ORF type:complete len:1153 (-),score=282.32 TRINITY_DN7955_c0_g1_i1:10-3468(-)
MSEQNAKIKHVAEEKAEDGDGSVRVTVRVRPFIKEEYARNDADGVPTCCISMPSRCEVEVLSSRSDMASQSFTFDRTYWSHSPDHDLYATQSTLYEELGREMLGHAISGYNTCIFAYGQTGSGKSYSVLGDDSEEGRGLLPRLVLGLFQHFDGVDSRCTCRVSFMEIHNEHIHDLLGQQDDKQADLKVRQHPVLGAVVEGLTESQVKSKDEVLALIAFGSSNRTVAATSMNFHSSRSHCIFSFKLGIDGDNGVTRMAQTHLVDLAGSERASRTNARGVRLKEGCAINQSLSTLARVISALAEKAAAHGKAKAKNTSRPPFRDSKLTYILKESLSGNSKTVMMAAISPSVADYEETVSTLRFAQSVKKVQLRASVNAVDVNAHRHAEETLRQELRELKKQLSEERVLHAEDRRRLVDVRRRMKYQKTILKFNTDDVSDVEDDSDGETSSEEDHDLAWQLQRAKLEVEGLRLRLEQVEGQGGAGPKRLRDAVTAELAVSKRAACEAEAAEEVARLSEADMKQDLETARTEFLQARKELAEAKKAVVAAEAEEEVAKMEQDDLQSQLQDLENELTTTRDRLKACESKAGADEGMRNQLEEAQARLEQSEIIATQASAEVATALANARDETNEVREELQEVFNRSRATLMEDMDMQKSQLLVLQRKLEATREELSSEKKEAAANAQEAASDLALTREQLSSEKTEAAAIAQQFADELALARKELSSEKTEAAAVAQQVASELALSREELSSEKTKAAAVELQAANELALAESTLHGLKPAKDETDSELIVLRSELSSARDKINTIGGTLSEYRSELEVAEQDRGHAKEELRLEVEDFEAKVSARMKSEEVERERLDAIHAELKASNVADRAGKDDDEHSNTLGLNLTIGARKHPDRASFSRLPRIAEDDAPERTGLQAASSASDASSDTTEDDEDGRGSPTGQSAGVPTLRGDIAVAKRRMSTVVHAERVLWIAMLAIVDLDIEHRLGDGFLLAMTGAASLSSFVYIEATLGRQIATSLPAPRPAGRHRVDFSRDEFAAFVYRGESRLKLRVVDRRELQGDATIGEAELTIRPDFLPPHLVEVPILRPGARGSGGEDGGEVACTACVRYWMQRPGVAPSPAQTSSPPASPSNSRRNAMRASMAFLNARPSVCIESV